jgi:hypothetical protein
MPVEEVMLREFWDWLAGRWATYQAYVDRLAKEETQDEWNDRQW